MTSLIQIWRLGASVVDKFTNSLTKHAGSNYHIITDNFFTSPQLLHSLREKGIAATGTVRLNGIENAPLKPVKEMENLERGKLILQSMIMPRLLS